LSNIESDAEQVRRANIDSFSASQSSSSPGNFSNNAPNAAQAQAQTFDATFVNQLVDAAAARLQLGGPVNIIGDLANSSNVMIEGLFGEESVGEEEQKNEQQGLLSINIEDKTQLAGAAASLGLVFVAANSAAVAASIAAASPAWRNMDPISILDNDAMNPMGDGESGGDEPDDSDEAAAERMLSE
jgi:hypothetical protein